ncbi:MAG: hypothetical protein ACFFAO_06210 [Candidatus Hermodarchaeota archaeon]
MIIDFVLTVISLLISVYAIIYIIIHRRDFGSKQNSFLLIFLYFLIGILYFISVSLATISLFDKEIALNLWRYSIISSLIALGFLGSLQSIILGIRKFKIVAAFIFSFISGIILNLLFTTRSFKIIQGDNSYYYIFQNYSLFYFMLLLGSFIVSYIWLILLINYKKTRDKELVRGLFINTLNCTIVIFTYSIFLLSQNIILKYTHLISFIITAVIFLYLIINKPNMFVELTNKIYEFIVFHKSGILLYSYNFETGKETEESILKGSILIGINHILSNLSTQRDKLRVIKMRNRDIVLEFDPNYGYAVLLITNKRNDLIVKSIQQFMNSFVNLNKDKLNNLNGLIDTSQFKNASELLQDYFNPYIK